jgi:hypothetical protein
MNFHDPFCRKHLLCGVEERILIKINPDTMPMKSIQLGGVLVKETGSASP